MLSLAVHAADQHRADLRWAADRDRRLRAPRTVHPARLPDPGPPRPRRASRWGATIAAVARVAR